MVFFLKNMKLKAFLKNVVVLSITQKVSAPSHKNGGSKLFYDLCAENDKAERRKASQVDKLGRSAMVYISYIRQSMWFWSRPWILKGNGLWPSMAN